MDIQAAHATFELLASIWPNCFSHRLTNRKPLKIGIGKELAVAVDGALTPKELDTALRLYTTQKAYLRTLKAGAQRVDLDGNPAGTVTPEQAAVARQRIEHLEARASARTRARGLAIEEAACKAKAEAEAAKRAAEAAKREAEVAAGKRKPLLQLPRSAAASATA
jgi:ProP effector